MQHNMCEDWIIFISQNCITLTFICAPEIITSGSCSITLIPQKAVLTYSFNLFSKIRSLSFFFSPQKRPLALSLCLCRSRSRSRSGDRGRRGGRSSGYKRGASSSRSPSRSLPASHSPSPSSHSAHPAATALPDKQRK